MKKRWWWWNVSLTFIIIIIFILFSTLLCIELNGFRFNLLTSQHLCIHFFYFCNINIFRKSKESPVFSLDIDVVDTGRKKLNWDLVVIFITRTSLVDLIHLFPASSWPEWTEPSNSRLSGVSRRLFGGRRVRGLCVSLTLHVLCLRRGLHLPQLPDVTPAPPALCPQPTPTASQVTYCTCPLQRRSPAPPRPAPPIPNQWSWGSML